MELEFNKIPILRPIYTLLKKELGVLRGYIDKNLKKEFIRESKLLINYLILFIIKKNKSL